MSEFVSIKDAKPKKEISVRAKVIDKQSSQGILKYRIGDETAVAEIMVSGSEKERFRFKKGDVIEITDVVASENLPLFIFTKKTEVNVISKHIPDEKILRVRFIDQIPEFGYTFISGFISRIFDIYGYYCNRCKKFSKKVCSCGNLSERVFKIAGIFSDSTGDILCVTNNKDVGEKIANRKADDLKIKRTRSEELKNKREIVKGIMNHDHKFFGYKKNKKFIVVDAEY